MTTPEPPAAVAATLSAVRARIAAACAAAGRPPGSVALVAVSKAVGPEAIRAALAAGQREFGENYAQEALAKIAALPRSGVRWHYLGPVQGNKTGDIARHFDWVHSVDRDKVARRLSEQRPGTLPALDVCVQVNISGETSKSGVAPDAVAALCRVVATLPRLRLRGLMAIPAPLDTPATPRYDASRLLGANGPGYSGRTEAAARAPYRALRECYEALRREGFELDTLSAGMSDDLEAAIAEGSTLVRVGTAIFGPRRKP